MSSLDDRSPQKAEGAYIPKTMKSSCVVSNNISFPVKLRAMLDETAVEGLSHIVSWEMEGTAFRVHDPEEFVQQIMGQWFNQTKYKSFQRQLNLYGFQRVSRGPQKGCYMHDKFRRDKPDWIETICRKKFSDEEITEAELIAPSWLPDNTRSVLEPTPISDAKSRPMMDAFESFFQTKVALTPPRSENSKPVANALERILDQIIEPETSNVDSENKKTETLDHQNNLLLKRTPRCAVFPDKMHDMLHYCEANGLDHICRWEMQGRAIRIQSIELFTTHVMPRFFKLTKFESLQRQLNLYSFTRISKGPMKGCYYHPLFVRGGRSLSKDMQRRKPEDMSPPLSPPVATRIAKERNVCNIHTTNETYFSGHKRKRVTVSSTPSVDHELDDDLEAMARDCFDSSSSVSIPVSTPSPLIADYMASLSPNPQSTMLDDEITILNNSMPGNTNNDWTFGFTAHTFQQINDQWQ